MFIVHIRQNRVPLFLGTLLCLLFLGFFFQVVGQVVQGVFVGAFLGTGGGCRRVCFAFRHVGTSRWVNLNF